MWIPYNANPEGIRDIDCTVRAVSAAMGQSWDEAYIGICIEGFKQKRMPSSNAVWGQYLYNHGFRRKTILEDGLYTVRDFCADHPKGLYVLAVSGHVLTVIDGDWYDFWDSSEEVPLYVWEA